MDELLRGNYNIEQPKQDQPAARTLEDEFEMAALKRLGGSMTFVAKRKVVWADENDTAGAKNE
jgi:hypothetical protein